MKSKSMQSLHLCIQSDLEISKSTVAQAQWVHIETPCCS